MHAIASGEAQLSGNESSVLIFGSILLGMGLLLFVLGLMIEFFSWGTHLESIAASSAQTLSLLRTRLAVPQDPARPGLPPRAA